MSPFWNHISGLLCRDWVETWKLAKKLYPGGDFNRGPKSRLPSLCLPSTAPPPLSVAILFIYQTRIGYIWIHNICQLYEFIGHRQHQFIFFMYEFISGSVICDVPPLAAPHTSLQLWIHMRHLTHQCSISLLPWQIRVCLAAPTS